MDLQQILNNLASSRRAAPEGDGTIVSVPEDRTLNAIPNHASETQANDPRLRPQSRSTASPRPIIDPATITTWQDGLRCATKIATQNPQFAANIRTMMEHQRKQEMRWYTERQALKQVQANRSRSTSEAQSILRSLANGENAAPEPASSPVDADAELARFDRKLYNLQVTMEMSMMGELKALGVPFFGTPEDLIISDSSEQSPGERPKWSPRVTRSELLGLQRRMIQHLEDLYRD